MRKVLYIFGLLTDEDIAWMANAGTRRRFDAGEMLIREGEPSESIVLVLDGRLAIDVQGFGVVARLGSGEIVGEMSMVDSSLPSATVTAEGRCRVLLLDKKTLLQKCDSDPGFGYRFYRALAVFLADRLRERERRLKPLGGLLHFHDEGPETLDIEILDKVSIAGDRFDRLLKQLAGE
jgi:CRP/FNR family cyclic AMP-dependent transcriptional regulator